AIRWNAVVLLLGFCALSFSVLRPDRELGILLAAAIAVCYLMTLLLLPRLLLKITTGLLLLVLLLPGSTMAQEAGSSQTIPPAFDLMQQLEVDFRSGARIIRIDFATTYAKRRGYSLRRTMWGVVDGDTTNTHLMYVVTDPKRMSGTTLLFVDKADTSLPDSTWLYLSLIKRTRLLDIRSARAIVPGTTFSYEDSRGFVPIDKYSFQFDDSTVYCDTCTVQIKATPRTEQIKSGVGFDHMQLVLDLRRNLLTHIDYCDSLGEVLKTYDVNESTEVGGVNCPARVSVKMFHNGSISNAVYQYTALTEAPAEIFFDPTFRTGTFYDRLRKLCEQQGITVPVPES
ncbi:MAG: outer membrane lipoprotein-sorting protein, partial [candidate division Zixibacteria bacterium]